MSYYATLGLILSKEGDRQLKARLSSLPKKDAAIANALLRYADQRKTHRKTGAKLFIWNTVKEDDDFNKFFGRLIGSLPFDEYRLLRIGDALDDSMEDGGFYDDPFFLHIERNLAFE